MSTDFNGREPEKPITDQDGMMFASQPIWERSRKRKGLGGRPAAPAATVAPEPRSVSDGADREEPMTLDRPMTTAASSAADGVAANNRLTSDQGARPAKSNNAAPAAIAAAVVVLGALGAAGWYMSRDAGPAADEVAVAPLTPTDPPAQVAVNPTSPPPAAVTPRTVTQRVETPRAQPQPQRTAARTARVRPATPALVAADSAGVNASATAVLPDGPQPYSSLTPGAAAPTQVNPAPAVTLPPTSEAPDAIPSTPPTLTPEPAPTTQAPQPDPATPPQ